MMKLFWTHEADQDRDAIYDYIEIDNPAAAFDLDALFSEQAALLIENPGMGRPGRMPGTRELVAHRHYLLVYDTVGDLARILRVMHTARQWPPQPQPPSA